VGPAETIHLKDLFYHVLKDKIAEVLQPQVKQRAAALGEKLRQENGVHEAIRIIDEYATTKRFEAAAL